MNILKEENYNMEDKNEVRFEKDLTPYLVFLCSKCQQYVYVKTTQKAKKCLRCRCTYQVKEVLNHGIIVNGMTTAVNKVKELQNQLGTPEFQTGDEFVVASKISSKMKSKSQIKTHKDTGFIPEEFEDPYSETFQALLNELSQHYPSFPLYMIEVIATNYSIPQSTLQQLIDHWIMKHKLVKNEKNLYYVNPD